VGINGETPSELGEDPRFNYQYVNFMGRSTYRGFPGTDRESPALVSEALDELKKSYPIARYFVGGHSQGGFLTYSLLMNSPERIAGAFPISCGLIFQCEPTAYKDEPLKAAQRTVPLAIVHGKNDPVVDFGMSQYAAGAFGEAGWPGLRFFTSDNAGHMFMLLPVGEAIRWLEGMSSDDPKVLLEFAEKQARAGHNRDAVAALRKVAGLKPGGDLEQRAARLNASINARARPKAEVLAKKIKANKDGGWIDDFLAFRDEYEFTDAARAAIDAFAALRKTQEPEAQKTFEQAITAFRQGKPADGYAKYQEIVDKFYASSRYRNVKEQLKARPK
jgi:predicted esterase